MHRSPKRSQCQRSLTFELFLLLSLLSMARASFADSSSCFGIHVVDAKTGRGVPLVELKTVSNIRYVTDSAGWAAIDDPALLSQTVFFSIKSHGYEFPADGFGNRGVRLRVASGMTADVKINRVNVAERLYRITGEGIYRDSVMLGKPVPIEKPLLNAQVTGQDSDEPIVYKNKIRFFWGDTGRQSYPLGHFGTAGATADLPESGGLDPSVGINLHYFTDAEGFSRPMVPDPPNNLRWVDGVTVLRDSTGNEKLLARVEVHESLSRVLETRLLIYNDKTDRFDLLKKIDKASTLGPIGHGFPVRARDVDYFYYGLSFPNIRVRANIDDFENLTAYEGFTCLKPGARFDDDKTELDRDASGKLVWDWKKDTAVLEDRQIDALLRTGKLKRDELWLAPKDVTTGKALHLDICSVAHNDYRKKYVGIAAEIGGKSSFLGEIWYAEAAHPEGPWKTARKIVTHDHYSFYNPVHDVFYDQDGGRVIYFEGTYATTFSRDDDPTPRYDYNQIMYRLDLADPRLALSQ
jgi:hypothetical protein